MARAKRLPAASFRGQYIFALRRDHTAAVLNPPLDHVVALELAMRENIKIELILPFD